MPHSGACEIGVSSESSRIRRLQRWTGLIPGWSISTVAVLEIDANLTPALNLQWRNEYSSVRDRGAVGSQRLADSVERPAICFRNCSSASQLVAVTNVHQVVCVVLDCRRLAAEPLVALRLLSRAAIQLPMIAVADADYVEVAPLLMEFGCSTILTQLPVEEAICRFVSKAVDNI